MKVSFLQSGGFAGVTKGCVVDSTLLEPKAATEIEKLVHDSGLKVSGTFLSGTARDLSQYDIVVERDGQPGEGMVQRPDSAAIRVVFDDTTVPAPARALLSYLKQRARPRPPA